MIKGKKINLRTFREKDLEPFHILDADISCRGEYYPMDILTEPALKKWFNENGIWDENFGRMLILDKEDKILGYINYFKSISYFDSYEIGYILFDNKNRNKGIITEAVNLFVNYLFRATKINRLEIRTHPENIASQKVAEKCGFLYEGINRGAIKYKDTYKDLKQYSLIRKDYYELDKIEN